VRQLLQALLDHGLSHGASDRPVWLLLGGDERSLDLTVRYDGELISADKLPDLFEPFSDVGHPEAEPTVKLSHGLGLYLAREVAGAHGGSVSITSTREEGTSFKVTLPRFPFPADDAVRH
jgi:signal transduction histidine kinase